MVPDRRATATIHPPAGSEEPDAAFKAQEGLTKELSEHSDPHVRLIAHMSQRQLDMAVLLGDMKKSIDEMRNEVNGKLGDANRKLGEIQSGLEGLETRVSALEDYDGEHMNGASPAG